MSQNNFTGGKINGVFYTVHSEAKTSNNENLLKGLKGGLGSCNWGHSGRPGKRGGSGAGGGLASLSLKPDSTIEERRTASRKPRKQPEAPPSDVSSALSSNEYQIENPNAERSLGGINESYKVHVEGDGDAIIKPDMPRDIRSKNEVSAYEMSQAMGFDNVPVTVRREGGTYKRPDGSTVEEAGSAQQWVKGARTGEKDIGKADERSFSRMVLMDGLMNNDDRHSQNFLVNKEGKVIAIDNDKGFSWMPKQEFHRFTFREAVARWTDQPGKDRLKFNASDIDAVANLPKNTAFKKSFVTAHGQEKYDVLMFQTSVIAKNKSTLIEGVDFNTVLEED